MKIEASWGEVAELIKKERGIAGAVERIYVQDGRINVHVSDQQEVE